MKKNRFMKDMQEKKNKQSKNLKNATVLDSSDGNTNLNDLGIPII